MIHGPVPTLQVDDTWPAVADGMEQALRRGRGGLTSIDLYRAVRAGHLFLHLIILDEEIKGAFISELTETPYGRTMTIKTICGREMKRWLPELLDYGWPHVMGAKRVIFEGRKGWERAIKSARVIRQTYELDLADV